MRDHKKFRYQHFVAVFGNPSEKVPVVDDKLFSHEQEINPTTSPDENSVDFEFPTDCNLYLDSLKTYLALKIILVKERGFDTYKTTKKRSTKKKLFLLKQATMTYYRRGRGSASYYSCEQYSFFLFF